MVEFAFESGGTNYFQFKEAESAYCMRALAAMQTLEEMNQRCTREYLLIHTMALDNLFSNPQSINMADVFALHQNLKERLNFVVPTEDLIWKMSSVAFFDKTENIKKYDQKYGLEKIKRWKQDEKIPDFFLSTPIKTMFRLPDISVSDLETCLKVIHMVDQKHQDFLFSLISEDQRKSNTASALLSQKSLQSI